MHYAAFNGHNVICSLLLEKGVDIAAIDKVSDAEIVNIIPHMHAIPCTYIHLPDLW